MNSNLQFSHDLARLSLWLTGWQALRPALSLPSSPDDDVMERGWDVTCRKLGMWQWCSVGSWRPLCGQYSGTSLCGRECTCVLDNVIGMSCSSVVALVMVKESSHGKGRGNCKWAQEFQPFLPILPLPPIVCRNASAPQTLWTCSPLVVLSFLQYVRYLTSLVWVPYC